MNRELRLGSLALAGALLPTAAFAHTGIGPAGGLAHGFMHPLGGLDHILAMVAVGLLAAHLGGRALWMVPAAFMTMMAVGGVLGMEGMRVPLVEAGIAASVIVLGLMVALRWTLPVSAAATMVGLFAIFHGHAHGTEMPMDATGFNYGLGFVLATGLLHAAGIGAGLAFGKAGARADLALRAGGGAIAVAGTALLTGYL
ncbi:MAG TPA: HupE/UreJ family protein [Dongiaceae bacterium]|nr:HupE/UreJ family protein [Dongiaceae bacterium]